MITVLWFLCLKHTQTLTVEVGAGQGKGEAVNVTGDTRDMRIVNVLIGKQLWIKPVPYLHSLCQLPI